MIDPSHFLLLFAGLMLSVFFAGIEMAFMAANKIQIELSEKNGILSGRIIGHLLERPAHLFSTTLVGRTLALVLYVFGIAALLHTLLGLYLPAYLQSHALSLIIQMVIAGLIVLFTADFLPRSFFAINPNRVLALLAIPILIFYYLLFPVVWLIEKCSRWLGQKVFRLDFADQTILAADLDTSLNNRLYHPEQEATPEVDELIFNKVLEFRTVKVRDCMVPRMEVEAVEVHESIDSLRAAFTETGHSKILVYQDSIDNIIGYCHQLAMFKQPQSINEILSPVSLVPESMLASELFVKFVSEHRSVAVVVDEFGGTSGIVTVEDVVEEIFGEIEDEYDLDEALLEKVIPEQGIYLFSARHEIDYLNAKYGLGLPEGDYETLGGLFLSAFGEIPLPGDQVEVPPYIIEVIIMDENRIDAVKLLKKADSQVDDSLKTEI
ncbi:hemolysin family protein [Pontibacter arcticus]|uniref:Hemolysin n=1 Tax=Pontibacter arcticus TaxID=2080288 RepID=A0A364RIX5_9BACT|nr:hemolysin family protein [Pontibacter arcticus]RAU84223.1 hemolysin [Pontibacter arcticus]